MKASSNSRVFGVSYCSFHGSNELRTSHGSVIISLIASRVNLLPSSPKEASSVSTSFCERKVPSMEVTAVSTVFHTYLPRGCSPAGVELGPVVSPTRALVPRGVRQGPCSRAELALEHGRADGDACSATRRENPSRSFPTRQVCLRKLCRIAVAESVELLIVANGEERLGPT